MTERSARGFSETLFRAATGFGLHAVQKRGENGAQELSSWRLHLESGESHTFQMNGEETVVILQGGRGTWSVGKETWDVSRTGVFTEPATALYLPPGETLTCRAEREMEVVLISTPVPDSSGAARTPALVRPQDIEVLQRGTGPFEREIHNIFLKDNCFERLLVGETFNPPGKWSSYPPHKHDGRDGEPYLEEVYHYRIDPPQGFGLQVLYTLDGEETDGEETIHRVGDRDAVLLPYGFHPVAAAPGYRLCYLWVLSGEQRELALFEDPDHVWTHEFPEGRS